MASDSQTGLVTRLENRGLLLRVPNEKAFILSSQQMITVAIHRGCKTTGIKKRYNFIRQGIHLQLYH